MLVTLSAIGFIEDEICDIAQLEYRIYHNYTGTSMYHNTILFERIYTKTDVVGRFYPNQ